MKLDGANPSPLASGLSPLPGIANYCIGNDPKKWRTHIPTYQTVEYKEVYPGIDLAYYGNQGKLECALLVPPVTSRTRLVTSTSMAQDPKGVPRIQVWRDRRKILSTPLIRRVTKYANGDSLGMACQLPIIPEVLAGRLMRRAVLSAALLARALYLVRVSHPMLSGKAPSSEELRWPGVFGKKGRAQSSTYV